MSIDPFEARLAFLKLLRSLSASQDSIGKVVSYATKHGARCGEDLWECIREESAKGTLNTRINILYFLDSLCETSVGLGPPDAPYIPYVERDLIEIVNNVVPPDEGFLNLRAATQILESWRTRRLLDPVVVDNVLLMLKQRTYIDAEPRKRPLSMSRAEVMQRIEEDRERQKRLRERIWILPIPPLRPAPSLANPSPSSPFTPASPSSAPSAQHTPRTIASLPAHIAPASLKKGDMAPPPRPEAEGKSAMDVEFEQLWETSGELEAEDFERMAA